jgi:hypothetical protein
VLLNSFLRGGLAVAGRVTPEFLLPRLEADTLIAASGVQPDAAAREGLRRLMAALAKDTALSFFGRMSVHWDMIRLLRNAARIERAHRDNPALAAAAVAAPIFILGLPRSGTTFLHTLMAEDDENLVPRNWQTMFPAPRPAGFAAERSKSVRTVNRQLKLLQSLAPGFAALHPVHADSPQECSEITSHVFESLRFDTIFHVPDYLAWLDAHGDLAGFEFHKRFLQFLQDGRPSRWVLKCPDHTFSLDVILQVYPDARFVIVHRDPLEVFDSVASLTEVLRQPFLQHVDAGAIGRQVSERWIDGANRLVAFDRREDIAADRKLHIQHDRLVSEPITVIAEIYHQFGMQFSAPAEAAMRRGLAAQPQGGYRHAPYQAQRFNVNPEWLRERFALYVAAYCGGAS